MDTPGSGENRGGAPLRDRLENAAAGLRFVSEMDHPFSWVTAADPDSAQPLTVDRVRAAFRIEAAVPGEERSLERFFAGHIEEVDLADPVGQANVPRFRQLREVLESSLTDPRVYCFGETEKRCFVVGRTPDAHVSGLETRIAET